MVNLLKSFGKGILYIIGLPFFILALLLYGIYGIFMFLFMLFKGLILFFTGRSLFEDLPEDRKAKEILHPTPKADQKPEQFQQEIQPQQSEKTISAIPEENRAPISNPEPIVEPVPQEEPKIEPEPEIETQQINFEQEELTDNNNDDFLPNFVENEEPIPVNKPIEEKEEIIGKYTPKTSVFDDLDMEDDEPSGGVRIERSDK